MATTFGVHAVRQKLSDALVRPELGGKVQWRFEAADSARCVSQLGAGTKQKRQAWRTAGFCANVHRRETIPFALARHVARLSTAGDECCDHLARLRTRHTRMTAQWRLVPTSECTFMCMRRYNVKCRPACAVAFVDHNAAVEHEPHARWCHL
jgi:hypothetical protein